MRRNRCPLIVAMVAILASCASEVGAPDRTVGAPATTTSTVVESTTILPAATLPVATIIPPITVPPTSTPTTTATTPTNTPTTTATTTATTPTNTPTTTATTAATTATTTAATGTTPYGVPIGDGVNAAYAREHSAYPASDVFAGGCGARVISPVDGTLLEVRRENRYDATVDNPALRGGRSVAVLGDDGVRYYFAHFETIDDGLVPGSRIALGDTIGHIGETGRAGACHLHFGISPPCPGQEWSVRRGAIWPWPYLDAWSRGEQASPKAEVDQWLLDHPSACADAMADPNAGDA